MRFRAFVASFVLAVFVLAGCAQKTQPTAQPAANQGQAKPAASAPQETKHVRFVTVESDPPSIAAFRELIAQFENEHPGVKIDLELLGADQLATKLTASIAAKSPPDVSQADPEQVVDFANKGYLAETDDVINAVSRSDYINGSIINLNGHDYSIPYAGSATVLWYRKDLFEKYNVKPPTNWAELIEAAKKLTVDTNGDGKPDVYGISLPAGEGPYTEIMMEMFMWANGQTLFDRNLNLTFNNPATIEALKTYAELAKYAPPDIGTYSYYETIDAFGAGKAAMAPYAGRLLPRVAANNPALEPLIAAAPWPAQKVAATYGNWKSYIVFKDSKVQKEAKEWAKFITTGKQSLKFLLTVPSHLLPPVKSVQALPEFRAHPLLQKHAEDLNAIFAASAYAIQGANEAGAIQNGAVVPDRILNPYVATITARKIIPRMVQMAVLQGKDPKEAVTWADKELQAVLASIKK